MTTGAFTLETPLVLTSSTQIEPSPSTLPLQSIGNIGDYAVNAIEITDVPTYDSPQQFFYKNNNNQWVFENMKIINDSIFQAHNLLLGSGIIVKEFCMVNQYFEVDGVMVIMKDTWYFKNDSVKKILFVNNADLEKIFWWIVASTRSNVKNPLGCLSAG